MAPNTPTPAAGAQPCPAPIHAAAARERCSGNLGSGVHKSTADRESRQAHRGVGESALRIHIGDFRPQHAVGASNVRMHVQFAAPPCLAGCAPSKTDDIPSEILRLSGQIDIEVQRHIGAIEEDILTRQPFQRRAAPDRKMQFLSRPSAFGTIPLGRAGGREQGLRLLSQGNANAKPIARRDSARRMQNRDMTGFLSFGIERFLHLQGTPVLIASQHGSFTAAHEREIEIRLPAHLRFGQSMRRSAPNHFGMEPSTPSTYQLIAISCSWVSADPGPIFVAPALSLMGPAKGRSFPSTMARFLSSNSRATSAGTDLLSGVSTTMFSLMPFTVWRPPVQVPAITLRTSSM